MKRFVVGIDLGGTFIKGALFDLNGELLKKARRATEVSSGKEQVIENICGVVSELTAGGADPLAVGVGVPGIISSDKGTIVTSPNFPGWDDYPMQKILEEKLNVPVAVENDANCAAMGEKWVGAGTDSDNFFMLTLGTGIGGGIVINGEVWHGDIGRAGETGHINVVIGGRKCGCGSSGCLEAYSSGWGIVASAQEKAVAARTGVLWDEYLSRGQESNSLTPRIIYQEALKGDPISLEVYKDAGFYIGVVIGGIVNLMDIHTCVIGGGVSEAFELFYEPIKNAVANHIFGIDPENIYVKHASTGNDAGILGAGYTSMRFALLNLRF